MNACKVISKKLSCPFRVTSNEDAKIQITSRDGRKVGKTRIIINGDETNADVVTLGSAATHNRGNSWSKLWLSLPLVSGITINGRIDFNLAHQPTRKADLIEICGLYNNKTFRMRFRGVPLTKK